MLSRLENCFWLEGSTTQKIMTTFGFSIPPSCFAVAVLWELHIITLLIYQERRSAAATTTSGLRAGKADNQEAQKSYSPAVKALRFPPSLSSFYPDKRSRGKKEEEETRRSRVSFFPPSIFFSKSMSLQREEEEEARSVARSMWRQSHKRKEGRTDVKQSGKKGRRGRKNDNVSFFRSILKILVLPVALGLRCWLLCLEKEKRSEVWSAPI